MTADARTALARRIYETAHITGEFTLRSGAKSNEYFDKYLFESDPKLLKDIAAAIVPLSQLTGLPVLFVRKKAKDYGTCKISEGGPIRGRKLLIVEDVVTVGGAILDAAKALVAEGAQLAEVVCVIDRESGGAANLAKVNLTLKPLFTMTELKQAGG
jgi:orotate phosphoribosyltransferase